MWGSDAAVRAGRQGMMREAVYDVFARKSRGEPLHHVGALSALGDELARVYAWKTYDEENWFEMCVVPRAAILPVNRTEEGPFGGKRAREGGMAARIPPGQPYGGDS